MKGVTVVVIEHPQDNIVLEDVANRNLTLAQLSRALKAFSIGALGDRRTTVRVAQGEDTSVIADMPMTAATGTVTLADVGGAAASGAVIFTSSTGAWTATINGFAFAGTSAGDDAAEALELATAISGDPELSELVTALNDGTSCVIEAVAKGTAGNAFTLAVTGTGVARSAATLTGGLQGAVTVTLGGEAVVTDTTNLTDTAAATAVAAAFNADGNASAFATAEAADEVVTLTAPLNDGAAGNRSLVSTSATGTATRSAATLTGGVTGAGTFLERT